MANEVQDRLDALQARLDPVLGGAGEDLGLDGAHTGGDLHLGGGRAQGGGVGLGGGVEGVSRPRAGGAGGRVG